MIMSTKNLSLISRVCLSMVFISMAMHGCKQKPQKNPDITSQEVYEHINYLASDTLKGRYPGSKGGKMAAEYIHQQLNDYGLTPLFENGYQNFKVVTNVTLADTNTLILNNDTLTVEKDFMPLGFSGNGIAEGEVEFVGYGFEIEQDSLKWNDYALTQVQGKWALILRGDPEPDNMMSDFIPYAGDRAKVTLAKDKGAIGVLLVNGLESSKKDTPLELTYDQNLSDAGIPVVSITRKAANKIMAPNMTIEELEHHILSSQRSMVMSSQVKVKAHVTVNQNRVEAKNVAFKLNAPNAADTASYIVVGAHFDHLGMGGEAVNSRMPDTVAAHNGADDNASGTAGMIEIAGYLKGKADTLKQNFIFVAFDAEEMGTLGSKYFVNNLPVKKEKIATMINFDMIGRMKSDSAGISIGGTGTAAEYDSILNLYSTPFNKHFSPDGYGPSDHAPFYSANIPVLFFSTGAHSDYHTPLDDIEKLDIKKEKEILDYAAQVILELSTQTDPLTFQSTGSPSGNSRRTRLKVTLGIIPDVAGIVKGGLGIDGVRPGGPAEKGGIQKGDKITAINGDKVTNIYDYMFRLSKIKPETTAIVEVERNGEKEVLLIQL